MKRLAGLVLFAVLAVFMSAGSDTTIKYFSFSAQPDHIDDLKKMIAEFEKVNPGIKVEFETAAWDSYFPKLQTLIASGTAPDTFELNYENFVTYASKNVLMNLDGLMKKDKEFSTDIYNKKALDAFKFNKSQYGLVESFSNVVLFYNKQLFDEAKLSYPDETWNWEKELETAKKLTNKEKGVYGTYAPIQFWEFYKTIEQNSGSILSADRKKVVINSPQNVKTLQYMIDKINKYGVTPSDAEMSGQKSEDLFPAGKLAMVRTGIWMIDAFKANCKFEWDVALEPGNTKKAHHFFANGVAIDKKSKHAEAAWKWLKFLTSNKAATKIRVDSQWELPAVNDADALKSYMEKTPPKNKKAIFKALDTLVVPPVINNWSQLTDIVGKELDKARLGIKTPKQALDDAKKEVEKILD